MNRRAFLQSIIAGGAVLTAAQARGVWNALQAEGGPMDTRELDAFVGEGSHMHGLRWREIVETADDLPEGDSDGTARVVRSGDHADTIFVMVEEVGWIPLRPGSVGLS